MEQRMFTYHGPIRGQGRPRATIRAGHADVYKAEADRTHEQRIRMLYKSLFAQKRPLSVPFQLDVVAYMPIPSSLSMAKKKALIGKPCERKPDLDNIVKSVLDALNNVAFVDDRLCAAITAQKLYSATDAHIDIRLAEMEEEIYDEG